MVSERKLFFSLFKHIFPSFSTKNACSKRMNNRHGAEIEVVSKGEVELLLAKARHVGVVVHHIWICLVFRKHSRISQIFEER